MSTPVRHIVLTGPPGIGKTTIIQKVCHELELCSIPTRGFYTSELRQGGRRIGFDVISLDGISKPLARVGSGVGPSVGQYVVQVQSFEDVALPMLQLPVGKCVTVIDEIGKMELFSKRFEVATKSLFSTNATILATIPLQKGKPIRLVEFIRNHPSVKLITVDSISRDHVVSDIANTLTTLLKENGA